MFSDPVFSIALLAAGFAVPVGWFFFQRKHRRRRTKAAPDPDAGNVEAAEMAEMAEMADAPNEAMVADVGDVSAWIEKPVGFVGTDEPVVAGPVLLEKMEPKEIVEASKPEEVSAPAAKQLEDFSQTPTEGETGVAVEEYSGAPESEAAAPALASAARAAVSKRSRVVEKPALAPEIDDQISAIDHRLNELEQLIDSIERCLAGFEPLRESVAEEGDPIPEAA